MKRHRVIVVGAGASGMAAALSAAVSGAQVCLLEAAAKPGRSILASGNGRCNFANADLAPERYNAPAFVARTMGDDPLGHILDAMGKLGLWYVCDDEGRLYPRSRAAASVRDVLLHGMGEYGVELCLESRVVGLARHGETWEVRLEDGARREAEALVWAAGGGSGEVPSRDLGIERTAERPALCPLACDPRPPKMLDGVRVSCAVSLYDGASLVTRQEGEVLFRPYGVSGIVVFDLSRLARPGDTLVLDLMPDVPREELARVLGERAKRMSRRLADPEGRLAFLDGALHPKLARCLMERALPSCATGDLDPVALARAVKEWRFTVRGAADAGQAQVTQGGLALGEFDAPTLEARRCRGFFACGEALDVDGECGGLNLAWAWVSGMVAGRAACNRN